MLTFKTLNLSITNVIFRFYAMMGIVIFFGFIGQILLGAVAAFVLAMSTILGISFKVKEVSPKVPAKMVKSRTPKQRNMDLRPAI